MIEQKDILKKLREWLEEKASIDDLGDGEDYSEVLEKLDELEGVQPISAEEFLKREHEDLILFLKAAGMDTAWVELLS